jgi:malate dehydrogenase
MKIKNICITGAAGNIAYSLIFRVLSKLPFKSTDKINLTLLDITQSQKSLIGLRYEVEDCAFSTLNSIKVTDDAENAFEESDYIIMVGAKPRSKGMERSDLILDNANIFKSQASLIDKVCSPSTKVIVVGNPANTNALILNYNTPSIPNENITSLMKLDQNRAKSILAEKINEQVEEIQRMIIWGNHSTTQVPDLSNCLLNAEKINVDHTWAQNTFIPKVQKRGGEIIEYRGLSSAASAASAIYDHISIIDNGSSSWESLGIMTSGEYEIESGLIFSLPLNVTDKGYQVIKGLQVDDYIQTLIKLSEKELLKERDIVKSYLP